MEYQAATPAVVSSTQLAPESVLIQMLPYLTTAASFSPLADEVMEYQAATPAVVS
jgi:hypothetical protein